MLWYPRFEVDGGGSALDSHTEPAFDPPFRPVVRVVADVDPPAVMRPLRILFVTPYVPSPQRPRPLRIIRALAASGHRITLLAAATTAGELADLPALEPYCEGVQAVRVPVLRSLASCLRGIAGAAPVQALYCRSPLMIAAVQRALTPPVGYDLLHVEHLRAALYGLDTAALPRVYDAVDCMGDLLAQTAAKGPTLASRLAARVELQRTRRFERRLVECFDRTLISAERERDALLAAAGASPQKAARVHALPHGVDVEHFAPPAGPRDPATLVFVGRMAYHANLAAARYLAVELMPRIWTRRPDARLRLVGADPPAALRTIAAQSGSRVEVTGTVPDVRPHLTAATVSLSPLRYGVGVPNKVLEALATATPVVATTAACATLRAVPGEHLLVADDPDTLAHYVLGLLDDAALARRLGEAGRRYVVAHHDCRATGPALEAIYRDAIAAHAPGAPTSASVGTA